MIDELYDFVEQNRLLLLLIESLIDDYPGLGGGSVNDCKSALNGRLAAFLGSRAASGGLRPIADPQIAAYFLGESVARFAQHRKRDPTAAMIDDHQCGTPPSIARQTVRLAEVGRSPFHGEVPPRSRPAVLDSGSESTQNSMAIDRGLGRSLVLDPHQIRRAAKKDPSGEQWARAALLDRGPSLGDSWEQRWPSAVGGDAVAESGSDLDGCGVAELVLESCDGDVHGASEGVDVLVPGLEE